MRIRITFSKTEAMRYTGHLDLHRAWERTFRRAGLPLAYSQGFHPQPRLNLAAALPLGFTSNGEILDAWLETSLPVEGILQALLPALPSGIQVRHIREVDTRLPALQTQVQSAEYRLTLLDPIPDLDQRLHNLLSAKSLPRERRGKAYDLRPLIEALSTLPSDDEGQQRLFMRLAAQAGATGRPEEVLEAMGVPMEGARIQRTALNLSDQQQEEEA
jgi:radical SAM-linked protein